MLDLKTCTPVCGNFKNSIADAGGSACLLGGGLSSFAGAGSCGDYLAVAQSKKPTINIYQWCKPQVLYQCHLQEIMGSVASDGYGRYFAGGSKKGWLYLWEQSTGTLLNSWQAHFKAVSRIQFTKCGGYCVSASEDGMIRVWELSQFVDGSSSAYGSTTSRKSVTPYRSWSPHTLAVKDFCIIGGTGGPTFRVLSCSLDRSVVLYDVHACPPTGRQVLRVSLPGPLESVACSPTYDMAFAGSSSGVIYVVDLSAAAVGVSAANATVAGPRASSSGSSSSSSSSSNSSSSNSSSSSSSSSNSSSSSSSSAVGVAGVLEGHTRGVTALACSLDNASVVSASEDGSVRVWDMWTRQCLREVQPLNKTAITNCVIALRPELIGIGSAVHKPSLCPLSSLRKYASASSSTGSGSGSGSGSGAGSGSASSSSAGERSSLLLYPRVVGVAPAAHPYYPAPATAATATALGPDSVFGRPVAVAVSAAGTVGSGGGGSGSGGGAGGSNKDRKNKDTSKSSKGEGGVEEGGVRGGFGSATGDEGDDFVALPSAEVEAEVHSEGEGEDGEGEDEGDERPKGQGAVGRKEGKEGKRGRVEVPRGGIGATRKGLKKQRIP